MFKKLKSLYAQIPVRGRVALWLMFGAIVQKGMTTLSTPILTRLMTSEEYGHYSVYNSWLGILSIIITLNICQGGFTQGLVKYSDNRKIYSCSLQGLTLTLCVLWTGVYLAFDTFWNRLFGLTTVQTLAMLVTIWSSAVFGFWSAESRVLCRYKGLTIVTVFVAVAKLFLGILLVMHSQDKATAYILSIAGVDVCVYIWIFLLKMKEGKTFYSKKFWSYALHLNIPLVPHYLAAAVLSSADRIMIERMTGKSEAGIYNLAYSVSQVMTLMTNALVQTITPWICEKIKNNEIRKLNSIASPTLILTAMANTFLIAFAPELVRLFAPPEYYGAVWVIPPVAMSVYFMFAYNLFTYFAFYHEDTKRIATATLLAAVTNMILNYIFIQIFGYYAAGYTTLVCYILYTVFHYQNMRTVCKKYYNNEKPYDLKKIMAISGAFLAIGAVFLAIYDHILLRYTFILLLLGIMCLKKRVIKQAAMQLLSTRKKET